jgi:hypothetical protein
LDGRISTPLRGRWLKTYREAALKRAAKEEVVNGANPPPEGGGKEEPAEAG